MKQEEEEERERNKLGCLADSVLKRLGRSLRNYLDGSDLADSWAC